MWPSTIRRLKHSNSFSFSKSTRVETRLSFPFHRQGNWGRKQRNQIWTRELGLDAIILLLLLLFWEKVSCSPDWPSTPDLLPTPPEYWDCRLVRLHLRVFFFNLLFDFFSNIYLLCIQCSVCMYTCRPEEGTRFHYRWLWVTMWLLGIELWKNSHCS